MDIKPYQSKLKPLSGTSINEVIPKVRALFSKIQKRTKRRAYIRSQYFSKQKIFFNYFWIHLSQKNSPEQVERLKLFPLALDLIQNSRRAPESNDNPTNKNEILHRFAGLAKDKRLFGLMENM